MNGQKVMISNNLLIVVTHYNNSDKLLRCLNSIRKYLATDYSAKLLLIDDYSNNYHFSIVLKIVNDYKVEFIRFNSNQGISTARNTGINYGINNNYSYLTFIDSDDHLINFITPKYYLNNDITFFNSIETSDNYTDVDNYKNFIIKNNYYEIDSIELLLTKYIVQPNRVPILTTCWAKIYKIDVIKKNNILFNIKMNTFEDVDFLLRYLVHAIYIKFNPKFIYAHTNNRNLSSLTFSKNANNNNLFSFLQTSRSLRSLIKSNYFNLEFNIKHFCACYYSISLIRLSVNRNIFSIFRLYLFINKRMNSRFFNSCFKNYNVENADGNQKIKDYILSKSPLKLMLFLIKMAKIRYG
jgi:hypothetical protein